MSVTEAIVAMEALSRSARMDGRVNAFREVHDICCLKYEATKSPVAVEIAQEVFSLIEAEMTIHASKSTDAVGDRPAADKGAP